MADEIKFLSTTSRSETLYTKYSVSSFTEKGYKYYLSHSISDMFKWDIVHNIYLAQYLNMESTQQILAIIFSGNF